MSETTDRLFTQMPSVGGMRSQLMLRTRGDKFIWGIVLLLALISVLVVYSATGSLAYKMNKGNNEIYLFGQTRPIRTLHRSDGWTPEKLDAQLKGALAASFTPLDRSGDVFSWDPV